MSAGPQVWEYGPDVDSETDVMRKKKCFLEMAR